MYTGCSRADPCVMTTMICAERQRRPRGRRCRHPPPPPTHGARAPAGRARSDVRHLLSGTPTDVSSGRTSSRVMPCPPGLKVLSGGSPQPPAPGSSSPSPHTTMRARAGRRTCATTETRRPQSRATSSVPRPGARSSPTHPDNTPRQHTGPHRSRWGPCPAFRGHAPRNISSRTARASPAYMSRRQSVAVIIALLLRVVVGEITVAFARLRSHRARTRILRGRPHLGSPGAGVWGGPPDAGRGAADRA